MSVSILVVYTGEETIRNWLQTKVKERQLYIRNDPGELETARTNNFKFKLLSLCHAHNLQLTFTGLLL